MLTKVHLVKTMVFLGAVYGCESWTKKKAECWRIDAFELWCWRRLLRVPWTSRRSNQSILKEISPEYSLEALMLKLKFQYFGHLMWRTDSLEKTLMLGKTVDMVGWHQWFDGHEFEQAPKIGNRQGRLACSSPWGLKESDLTERLNWSDWKTGLSVCEFHLELCREGVIAPRQFVYPPEISFFLYKIVGCSVHWKVLIIQRLIILPLHCLGYSSSWLPVAGNLFPHA